ncbi:MAG TPA: hypothetical protein VF771_00480 [Longimicrobiaceae bacterium]
MARRTLAAAALAMLAACATGGGARMPVPQVRVGESFRLTVGQTAVVTGEPLTVRFATVLDDSRCPVGVQCVRAGEGRIQVSMHAAGRDASVVVLATDPPQPQSASYGEYVVTLVELDPRPRQSMPTPPVYTATLRVTRR